jgi:hypothetical protein
MTVDFLISFEYLQMVPSNLQFSRHFLACAAAIFGICVFINQFRQSYYDAPVARHLSKCHPFCLSAPLYRLYENRAFHVIEDYQYFQEIFLPATSKSHLTQTP